MKQYWSKRVRDMVPYVPGEQPKDRKFIKLNTNENPYPPSPQALSAVRDAAGDALRLYPDPECTPLREAIARHNGLDVSQVFCGNGSDEILSFAFQAFFDKENPITFPDITYSFYEVYVKYLDLTASLVPLNADFSLPVERFVSGPTGGVVIANPNAPTGQAVSLVDIRRVLEGNPDQVVIVDEAYVDFGCESAVELIGEFPNLLVTQTASKSRSLAGLRVGWALGSPDLISAMCCVRDSINSYTVDRVAQAAAAAAIGDEAYFNKTCRAIMATRERAFDRLKGLGFLVEPSQANFLFVRHPEAAGKLIFQALRERGILVRRWDLPRIGDHLRISIGTDGEMDALCLALEEIVTGLTK